MGENSPLKGNFLYMAFFWSHLTSCTFHAANAWQLVNVKGNKKHPSVQPADTAEKSSILHSCVIS
jgi:hypothetical protein